MENRSNMAIKRIQLRGISHTPSDNMTADGGCDESVNFFTDKEELAPMDAFDEVDGGVVPEGMDRRFEPVFIHKTPAYENVIYALHENIVDEDEEAVLYGTGLYTVDMTAEEPYTKFIGFSSGESLIKIDAIGNTLIVLTDQRKEFVLFNNGYNDIGSDFPELKLKVDKVNKEVGTPAEKAGEYGKTIFSDEISTWESALKKLLGSGWSTIDPVTHAANGELTEDDVFGWNETDKGILSLLINRIKELRDRRVRYFISEYHCLIHPVFVRYAFRLYDGTSHVMHSAPILIDPRNFTFDERQKSMFLHVASTSGGGKDVYFTISSQGAHDSPTAMVFQPYQLKFTIGDDNASVLDKWKDVIKSVDISVSPLIDKFRYEFLKCTDGNLFETSDDFWGWSNFHLKKYDDDEMLSSESLFYIIKTLRLDEYIEKITSGEREFSLDNYSVLVDGTLATCEQLPDDVSDSRRKLLPKSVLTFNQRMLMSDVRIEYPELYYQLPSRQYTTLGLTPVPGGNHLSGGDDIEDHEPDTDDDEGGEVEPGEGGEVIPQEPELEQESWPATAGTDVYVVLFECSAQSGKTVRQARWYSVGEKPGSWLFYPDPRCKSATVYRHEEPGTYEESGTWYKTEVTMREDEYLNGSFYFAGWNAGTDLWEGEEMEEAPSISADKYVDDHNTIYQSAISNPFVVESRKDFPAGIIGASLVTAPLSQGQFGYADLYVFTKEGIYTISTAADGSFGQYKFLSSSVAFPGTICQLEQAVAYVSDRGLMLLVGSQIRCLSDKMLDRSFSTSQLTGLSDLLEADDEYAILAPAIADSQTFFDYIKDCVTMHDVAGNRLLMMKAYPTGNDVNGYCYVYDLGTDTFGKCLTPYDDEERYNFSRAINSYPDAIATFRKSDGTFTAVRCNKDNSAGRGDDTPYPVSRCLLVTRSINLDETYARKRVNRLRIRGTWDVAQQTASKVRYILYGSMDGNSWMRVTSLHGPSHRFYRIVVLATLKSWDRISWIDIDYTTTFQGRIM